MSQPSELYSVVLQEWQGDSSGKTVSKNSFQIFVEGPAIVERRGGRPRELIGFVGKQPGAKINYLPVANAFEDLLPAVELKIRQGLLEWRKSQASIAAEKLAEATRQADSTSDPETKLYADEAVKAAQSLATAAQRTLADEQSLQRASVIPDIVLVKSYIDEISKPADTTETTSADDADQQNL